MELSYYKKFEPIDGKWYITKEIGSGAFGTVFEVERKDFPDMKAALKVVSIPSSQSEVSSYREENYDLDEQSVTSYFYSFVEEFIKEFRLMSQLKGHTNIVSYEDHNVIQREDGIGWDIFIRMELLTPMNKYFAAHAPQRSDIIRLGVDICKALEVCQQYQIIHRDIKPSNIFISPTGDYKLGDFGVARTLEKTSSGLSKKGTYTYMAPEVFKGEPYGANVDLYSLGIVLYRLLNNNMEPFREDRTYDSGERALERRMRGDKIPPPQNADRRLAEIVLKACSYSPEERYASPTQLREELEAILSGGQEAETESSDAGTKKNAGPSSGQTSRGVYSGGDEDELTAGVFGGTGAERGEEPATASPFGTRAKKEEETSSIFGSARASDARRDTPSGATSGRDAGASRESAPKEQPEKAPEPKERREKAPKEEPAGPKAARSGSLKEFVDTCDDKRLKTGLNIAAIAGYISLAVAVVYCYLKGQCALGVVDYLYWHLGFDAFKASAVVCGVFIALILGFRLKYSKPCVVVWIVLAVIDWMEGFLMPQEWTSPNASWLMVLSGVFAWVMLLKAEKAFRESKGQ